MTPGELYDAKEGWVEAQGGTSDRQRREGLAEFERLKRLYPDTPCQGSA